MREEVSTTADWQGSLGETVIVSLCPEGKPGEGRRANFFVDWHSTPHMINKRNVGRLVLVILSKTL